MSELKKKALNLLDDSPIYTYRLYFVTVDPGKFDGNVKSIKKLNQNSKRKFDTACWASYLRDQLPNGNYKPFIMDLKETWRGCEVTEFLADNPEFQYLHDLLVERILAQLDKHLPMEYDRSNALLYVDPTTIKDRTHLLLLLTKLRHIFEQPFVLTSMFAPLFKDDFPELDFNQISYLLEVYVKKGNSGHSLHRPSNSFGGGNTVYMEFDKMVKRAATRKFGAIHDSYEGETILFKEENPVSFGKAGLPNSASQKYSLVVKNKDLLIDKYFKVHEYKKSVSRKPKRINRKVA